MLKNKFGITLIALVITIVVLVILAGVGINLSMGENGILGKAQNAVDKYKQASQNEQIELAKVEEMINGKRDTITISKDELISLIKEYSNPPGTILAYGAATTENELKKLRLLKCEGQEISRTEYKDLFDVIGTTYGEGDGETTFKIPDLRGEFLRGTGTNGHTNQGSGDNVGKHQDGTRHPGISAYTSGSGYYNLSASIKNSTNYTTSANGVDSYESGNMRFFIRSDKITITTDTAAVATSYTSRPTNTSVLYCIKY